MLTFTSNDRQMLRRELAHGLIAPANAEPDIRQQVRAEGGFVASSNYSRGIIEAANQLLPLYQ